MLEGHPCELLEDVEVGAAVGSEGEGAEAAAAGEGEGDEEERRAACEEEVCEPSREMNVRALVAGSKKCVEENVPYEAFA